MSYAIDLVGVFINKYFLLLRRYFWWGEKMNKKERKITKLLVENYNHYKLEIYYNNKKLSKNMHSCIAEFFAFPNRF